MLLLVFVSPFSIFDTTVRTNADVEMDEGGALSWTLRMTDLPIPARILAPWIADNEKFVHEDLAQRRRRLDGLEGKRKEFLDTGKIRIAEQTNPIPLSAVDAAVANVPIGDLVSILIQVVHVADDSSTILGAPIRATGINGYEMSLVRTPMRVAAECAHLSGATFITIADTSFWSLLMEVNQAITRQDKMNNKFLDEAVHQLTAGKQFFISTILNPNVIAMSKSNQSCEIGGQFVSDREAIGRILQAGEFLVPQKLTESTKGKFGVEARMFNDAERKSIKRHFEQDVGVVFYRPHTWTRAFRIEAHLNLLQDDAWLMPLLAAISKHTMTRTIVEPYPQFLADWTSKRIEAVTELYGELNYHRTPWINPVRTGRAS